MSTAWSSVKLHSVSHQAAQRLLGTLVANGIGSIPERLLKPQRCPACDAPVTAPSSDGGPMVYACSRCPYRQAAMAEGEAPSLGIIFALGLALLYREAFGFSRAEAAPAPTPAPADPSGRPTWERILAAVADAGSAGMTTKELRLRLGATHQDVSARITELKRDLKVYDSGVKRERGAVWVITPPGQGRSGK